MGSQHEVWSLQGGTCAAIAWQRGLRYRHCLFGIRGLESADNPTDLIMYPALGSNNASVLPIFDGKAAAESGMCT